MITLFMTPESSGLLAADIAKELKKTYESLDVLIPKLKNQ